MPWIPENSVTVSDDNIYSKSLIVTDKKMVHFKQEHEELVIGIETSSSPNPRKDKSSELVVNTEKSLKIFITRDTQPTQSSSLF